MKEKIRLIKSGKKATLFSKEQLFQKSTDNEEAKEILLNSGIIVIFLIVTILMMFSGNELSGQTASLPRSTWVKDGIIDAGGSHEPYIFNVRRGGIRTDTWDNYLSQHSEENVKKLADLGVNVFHTHLYKGFGMAAEKDEMEMTKNLARLVHKYGMKLDTYVQWGSLMFETFFNEVPEAKNWVQVDQFGEPILRYSNSQPFRYTPCFNNNGYRVYFKKILSYALEEVKSDFIHFDNFGNNYEPQSCHCTACIEKFREFLRGKYDSKTLKSRLGFSNIDYVEPPKVDRWQSPWRWEIIDDPLMQEWIDFRCISMGDALKEMAEYIKSINPETVVEVNFNPGLSGRNIAMRALEPTEILPFTEVIWTEEGNMADYTDDKRLISEIRSFKMARIFNNIAFTYLDDNPVALAVDLSFNQTLGYLGGFSFSPVKLKYLDFYKANRNDYTGSKDVADVAILRSRSSMNYNNYETQLPTILFEQTMIQAKIPFNIIFDTHLKEIAKYRVLVLANQECLSDEQLDLIRNFVNNGGALIATDNSSLYTEWRRQRPDFGLSDLFGVKYSAVTAINNGEKRNHYGKGKVVYIPGIIPSPPLPANRDSFSSAYWRLPQNWQQLVSAVEWAISGDFSVIVEAPLTVVMNVTEIEKGSIRLIHLVNYETDKSLLNIPVSCKLPAGLKVRNISIKSPDDKTIDSVNFQEKDGGVYFIVPKITIYSLIKIQM